MEASIEPNILVCPLSSPPISICQHNVSIWVPHPLPPCVLTSYLNGPLFQKSRSAQPKLVNSKQFKIMEWKSKLTPYGVWMIPLTYGLIRIPRQSLLRGLSRWRYLKDVSDSCGKLDLAFTTKMSSRTAITILGYQRLVCFITFSHCAAFRTSPRASSRTSPRTSYRASSWTAFCLWRKWIIIVNTGIHNWY